MQTERKLAWNPWIRDLATFAIMAAIAGWQGWEARELIWSLWISSLVIGYAFIFVSSLSIYFTGRMPGDKRMKKLPAAVDRRLAPLAMNVMTTIAAFFIFGAGSTVPWLVLLINALFAATAVYLTIGMKGRPESALRKAAAKFFTCTPSVAFTLGFFTLHFGGFHFVHGLFLNQFFPIYEGTHFGETLGGTFEYVFGVVQTAARSYWPMVLISAWSRLGGLRKAFESSDGPNMFLPYVSVVKMHILIFVFAGLSGAGLQNWALYPVLLFYFFPAGAILKGLAGKSPKAATPNGKREPG